MNEQLYNQCDFFSSHELDVELDVFVGAWRFSCPFCRMFRRSLHVFATSVSKCAQGPSSGVYRTPVLARSYAQSWFNKTTEAAHETDEAKKREGALFAVYAMVVQCPSQPRRRH